MPFSDILWGIFYLSNNKIYYLINRYYVDKLLLIWYNIFYNNIDNGRCYYGCELQKIMETSD